MLAFSGNSQFSTKIFSSKPRLLVTETSSNLSFLLSAFHRQILTLYRLYFCIICDFQHQSFLIKSKLHNTRVFSLIWRFWFLSFPIKFDLLRTEVFLPNLNISFDISFIKQFYCFIKFEVSQHHLSFVDFLI